MLAGVITLAVVFSFLPARWGRWLDGFGSLAGTMVEPVKRPVTGVARWLAPAREPFSNDEYVAKLEKENAELQLFLDREKQEAARLRGLVEQLQGAPLYSEAGVKQMLRPVIGTSAEAGAWMLEVRAGTSDGVERNTVATVGGLQLLGRVERVTGRTCWVKLVTSRGSGTVGALIAVGDGGRTLACPLTPVGDGTLRGPVAYERDPKGEGALRVEVGQIARVDGRDGAWPKAARSLVIGKVERVDPAPDSPLRQIVTVRPTVDHMERVSEVWLLVTEVSSEK